MPYNLLNKKNRKIVLIADVRDAPFKCLVCRKVFINEGYLRRHYGRRHPSLNFPEHTCSSKVKDNLNDEFERNDQHSIKAVLNATERIEHLLVNLTYGTETENKISASKSAFETSCPVIPKEKLPVPILKVTRGNSFSTSNHEKGSIISTENDVLKKTKKVCTPLANSTLNEVGSDSLEDIGSYLEGREFSEDSSDESSIECYLNSPTSQQKSKNNSDIVIEQFNNVSKRKDCNTSININNLKEQNSLKEESLSHLQRTYSCLESEENKVLKRVMASKCEATGVETVSNLQLHTSSNKNPLKNYSLQQETLTGAHARLKHSVISKLNYKLRSLGVDPHWQRIPEKTAFTIGNLLKSEREGIIKDFPDYNKLRDLINHNANTRIKMSMDS